LSDDLIYSGEHRKEQWEKGWGQNLDELLKINASDAMIPRYFGKYEINRLRQKFIRPISRNFEYNMLGVILDWLFDKYLKNHESIYEFGCGTGHNLLRLRSFNSNANLWGLDWAESSQTIINEYAVNNADKKLFAHKYDYFNPDFSLELKKGSAIYTVASLEQIGVKYRSFVDYVLKNKPSICIHIEPVEEMLDEENLLDYLSICYFKKRKYLSGYLTYLKELESKGKLKIIKAQRSYIGSFFIEGYSVVVWAPTV
jgi:SAM-dependent methyltransferase